METTPGTPSIAPNVLGIDAIRSLSISHRTAALAELERLALSSADQAELRERLRSLGIEAVVLCTCNRTELYWVSRGDGDDRAVEHALFSRIAPADRPAADRFLRGSGVEAARHLFRVAGGLESLVVGESEILGQLREAIDRAEREDAAGFFLAGLFRAALRFGASARQETRIGAGALSVASAAVRLLARRHDDLGACTVVVVGAGLTGLKVARHLRADGVGRLALLNRTLERAREAAADVAAEAGSLDELPAWLERADVVVAAVQTETPLLTPERLALALRARAERPLTLVDLSLPRAIDPACATVAAVSLHDLSGLEQIVTANRERREHEIPRVEAVLERELLVFAAGFRESAARPLLAELRHHAERIRLEELSAGRDAGIDAGMLDRITRRLVDRLLHAPSLALRQGGTLDPHHAHVVRSLFGLASGSKSSARTRETNGEPDRGH